MKKGFSLLELLIVISIIGIMSSVVLVSIGKNKKEEKQVEVSARQVAAAIREVQNNALSGKNGEACASDSYTLSYTAGSSDYTLSGCVSGTHTLKDDVVFVNDGSVTFSGPFGETGLAETQIIPVRKGDSTFDICISPSGKVEEEGTGNCSVETPAQAGPLPFCGDGVCNGPENCSTCAADCGCGSGQTCTNGVCVVPACYDTCDSLGYECGEQTICGTTVTCANKCGSGSTVSCVDSKCYSWQISWGACSKSCGGGTRTGVYVCKNKNGVTVDNSYCPAPQPASRTAACNTQACCRTSGPLCYEMGIFSCLNPPGFSCGCNCPAGYTVVNCVKKCGPGICNNANYVGSITTFNWSCQLN